MQPWSNNYSVEKAFIGEQNSSCPGHQAAKRQQAVSLPPPCFSGGYVYINSVLL